MTDTTAPAVKAPPGDDLAITELVEFSPDRLDGVKNGATGIPFLILKAAGGTSAAEAEPAEVPAWLPAAKALAAAAIADPSADPADLLKAVNAAGEVDEAPDIAGGKQAIQLIARLIINEAQELEAGCLDEVCDIEMLLQAADCLRCWLSMERSAVMTDADADAMKGCGCCGSCTGPRDGCCASCGVAKAAAYEPPGAEAAANATELWSLVLAGETVTKDSRTFTAAERKKHAAAGNALPDGCLAAETLVITPDGVRPIESMVGPCRVLTDQGWSDAEVREYGVQQLHAVLLLREGVRRTVCATAGHRWYLADGQVKLTSELGPADVIGYVNELDFSHAEVAACGSSARSDASGVHELLSGAPAGGLLLARAPERRAHAQAALQGVRQSTGAEVGRGVPGAARHAGAHLGAEDPARVRRDPGAVRRDAPGAGLQVPAVRKAGSGASPSGRGSLPRLGRGARAALRLVQPSARLGRGDRPGADHGLSGWDVVAILPTGRTERVYCAVVPELRRFVLADGILTGNSYPIPDKDALRRAAILARSGHGDVKAARRLIARRARELGVPNPLDTDDKATKATAEAVVAEEATAVNTEAIDQAVAKALAPYEERVTALGDQLAKAQADLKSALDRPIHGGPVLSAASLMSKPADGENHAANAAKFDDLATKASDLSDAEGYRQLAARERALIPAM